jgi:hypothetical protein
VERLLLHKGLSESEAHVIFHEYSAPQMRGAVRRAFNMCASQRFFPACDDKHYRVAFLDNDICYLFDSLGKYDPFVRDIWPTLKELAPGLQLRTLDIHPQTDGVNCGFWVVVAIMTWKTYHEEAEHFTTFAEMLAKETEVTDIWRIRRELRAEVIPSSGNPRQPRRTQVQPPKIDKVQISSDSDDDCSNSTQSNNQTRHTVGQPDTVMLDGYGRVMLETRDAVNPNQNEMVAALGRQRTRKRGDGHCFFYSVGEAAGLMHGFADQDISNQLRKEMGAIIRQHMPVFFNDIMRMEPRQGLHNAMDAQMKAQMMDATGQTDAHGEDNWIEYYIKHNVETDKEWVDDTMGGMGAAMLFKTHVVILYSDIYEKIYTKVDGVRVSVNGVAQFTWGGYENGANPVLIYPNGDRRYVPFERLCTLFPPGPERDDLKVLLYNGNQGAVGDHFEHAMLKPVTSASTEALCFELRTSLSPNHTTSVEVPVQATPVGENEYQETRRRNVNKKNLGNTRRQPPPHSRAPPPPTMDACASPHTLSDIVTPVWSVREEVGPDVWICVSWNIHGFRKATRGFAGGTPLDRLITEQKPTLLMLQELWLKRGTKGVRKKALQSYVIFKSLVHDELPSRRKGPRAGRTKAGLLTAIHEDLRPAATMTQLGTSTPSQGYVLPILAHTGESRTLIMNVYIPTEPPTLRDTILQEVGQIIHEQRVLHPHLAVIMGGDMNAALSPRDRFSGECTSLDNGFRRWVSNLDLHTTTLGTKAHPSYVPFGSRALGVEQGAALLDHWLLSNVDVNDYWDTPHTVLQDFIHDSDHDPVRTLVRLEGFKFPGAPIKPTKPRRIQRPLTHAMKTQLTDRLETEVTVELEVLAQAVATLRKGKFADKPAVQAHMHDIGRAMGSTLQSALEATMEEVGEQQHAIRVKSNLHKSNPYQTGHLTTTNKAKYDNFCKKAKLINAAMKQLAKNPNPDTEGTAYPHAYKQLCI